MNKIETEAAGLILGKSGEDKKFSFDVFGIKIKLSIPPQKTKQVVKWSCIISKMTEPSAEGEIFPELVTNSKNINLQCKVIAVATGSGIPFLWRLIRRKATNGDIEKLFRMVVAQTDAERFFFTMGLAKGMNKLRKKTES